MSRIVVINHVTLDGVMQAPGRPDEDTRGGFAHGGWGRRPEVPDDVAQATDEAVGRAMSERLEAGGGLAGWVFGRRTYEDLLGHWSSQPNAPFGPMLLGASKWVASRTLGEPLPWPNSTLLRGDAAASVAAVKAASDGVLGIMGSGELIASLMAADLIDEYLLFVHPIVLGTGRRLFPDGVHATLRLTSLGSTPDGVVIATYEAPRG